MNIAPQKPQLNFFNACVCDGIRLMWVKPAPLVKLYLWLGFFLFNGKSTFAGYLMTNASL